MAEDRRLGLAEDYTRVAAANEHLAAALRHLTAEPSRSELEKIGRFLADELKSGSLTTERAVMTVVSERNAYRAFIEDEVVPALMAANVHILVDRAAMVLDRS